MSTKQRPRRQAPSDSKEADLGPPLTERWLRGLKNNRIVAVLVIACTCVGAPLTFYKDLPEGWRGWLETRFSAPQTNGWAWAGYLDRTNPQMWATGPWLTVVRPSPAAERPYPYRAGDIVSPTKELPQVIVNYKALGTENVLRAPWTLENAIVPAADYTGAKYVPGKQYLVADVSVAAFPGRDPVVWLRLIKSD